MEPKRISEHSIDIMFNQKEPKTNSNIYIDKLLSIDMKDVRSDNTILHIDWSQNNKKG